jgi:putative endonuclease
VPRGGRWFVYVVACGDGSIYTGIARDVAARVAAHEAGRGARYTRGRGPLRLLVVKAFASHGAALRIEYALKRLDRSAKIALVESPVDLARFVRRVQARHRTGAGRGPRPSRRVAPSS